MNEDFVNKNSEKILNILQKELEEIEKHEKM
jgi:hypothetical protein